MRLKIFLMVVIPALGLLVCLALLRPGPGFTRKERGPAKPLVTQAAPPANEARGSEVSQPVSQPEGQAKPATGGSGADSYAATVAKRVSELAILAMNDDGGSLGIILSELDNPEPQIRSAALQATIQFGSRDAIPYLQREAARTDDLPTRQALLGAAEYLNLPSATEIYESRRQASGRR
ncbi:MAG TPA: hypothetical protein VMU04_00970 [Candidatus Acidoferrum sp.]|nr:hypothetical protein [Candidatus Acidoferrum sp.]